MTALRAVFYDESDARAVARQLAQDGFPAGGSIERLAGEDDDEDHPWAVVTDAPEYVLELLVEQYDGWLDHEGPAPGEPAAPTPPLDLPDTPRRVKGHFTEG